jgi:hypothetical protein
MTENIKFQMVIVCWVFEPGSVIVPKMCSVDALGICDRITGDPWIHFYYGYIVDYLLLQPKKLRFVKNNLGNSLIRKAGQREIMRRRATYHIDTYSELFISEIYIFNLGFLTFRHYFYLSKKVKMRGLVRSQKYSSSKNIWRTQA